MESGEGGKGDEGWIFEETKDLQSEAQISIQMTEN